MNGEDPAYQDQHQRSPSTHQPAPVIPGVDDNEDRDASDHNNVETELNKHIVWRWQIRVMMQLLYSKLILS